MERTDFTLDYTANLVKCMLNNFSEKINDKLICLEIGCFEGLGSIKIYQYLCKSSKSKLYCIDLWITPANKDSNETTTPNVNTNDYYKFVKNTKKYPRIVEIKGYSQEQVRNIPDSIDFCHVDGSIIENDKYTDCVEVYKKMNNNGIIFINGYSLKNDVQLSDQNIPKNGSNHFSETKIGINKFLYEYKANLEVLEIGHGLTVKVKKPTSFFDFTSKLEEPLNLIRLKVVHGDEIDSLFAYSKFTHNNLIKILVEFELKYTNIGKIITCIRKLINNNFVKQKIILPERSQNITEFVPITQDSDSNNYQHDSLNSYYLIGWHRIPEILERTQKLNVVFYK